MTQLVGQKCQDPVEWHRCVIPPRTPLPMAMSAKVPCRPTIHHGECPAEPAER